MGILQFTVFWCQKLHLTSVSDQFYQSFWSPKTAARDKLPYAQIHLRWQNQNMKTFTRWPVVVLIPFTALWDQMFLKPLYIIWPPSTLLKGFIVSDDCTFAPPSVNAILLSFTAWKLDSVIRKVENVNAGRRKTQDSYASEMWMSRTFSLTTFIPILPT